MWHVCGTETPFGVGCALANAVSGLASVDDYSASSDRLEQCRFGISNLIIQQCELWIGSAPALAAEISAYGIVGDVGIICPLTRCESGLAGMVATGAATEGVQRSLPVTLQHELVGDDRSKQWGILGITSCMAVDRFLRQCDYAVRLPLAT